MFKFLFGATVGFFAGATLMAVGVIESYKRDGNLAGAEAAIQRGIDRNKRNAEMNTPALTVDDILRQARFPGTY